MENFPDKEYPRIGMGCWAIGGPMYRNENPLGYGRADDAEATKALETAYACVVRIFDTAAAYGTGHSETPIGNALGKRHDVMISFQGGSGH